MEAKKRDYISFLESLNIEKKETFFRYTIFSKNAFLKANSSSSKEENKWEKDEKEKDIRFFL